jgi:hypothetical protein
MSLVPSPYELSNEFARGHGNEAELVGEAGEKDNELIALGGLPAIGEVELVAIELGEVFSFDDVDQETQKPVVEAKTEKEQV